ncbi:MAG: GNAT family N-acetyltransferase [Planctomycetota bacterium]
MIARTTVGSLLRSTQAHCGQICSKETLDHGIAYTCERYPTLCEGNQLREVVVTDAARLAEMFDQTEQWFSGKGLVCQKWAAADGTAGEALRALLTPRGFRETEYRAMTAVRWPKPTAHSHVRILPARAMRQAFRDTFAKSEMSNESPHTIHLAQAGEERFDDPQWEMFVALFEGQAAGRCALYQVGDIARVMDLEVLPRFENRGIAEALLCHVMTLARRLALRNVCTLVEKDHAPYRSWLESAGFVDDGEITEFLRTGVRANGGCG